MMISEKTIWMVPKTASLLLSEYYPQRFSFDEYNTIEEFVETLSSRSGCARSLDAEIAQRLGCLSAIECVGCRTSELSYECFPDTITIYADPSKPDMTDTVLCRALFEFIGYEELSGESAEHIFPL